MSAKLCPVGAAFVNPQNSERCFTSVPHSLHCTIFSESPPQGGGTESGYNPEGPNTFFKDREEEDILVLVLLLF